MCSLDFKEVPKIYYELPANHEKSIVVAEGIFFAYVVCPLLIT